MLGGGQTARHKGREHLLSHCHSRDRVQICIKSFFSFIPDKHSTMQHNLQLEVGGEAGYGLLLQLLLGAMCAGQWGEPRECPGVSSSHKAPQGHLLAEGNHDSQDASTGTHLSLGARSTAFQMQFK